MQRLRVSVISAGPDLALPVEIYNPSGSMISSGAVSSSRDKLFELPPPEGGGAQRLFERVYVFARLPGRAAIQEVVEMTALGGQITIDAAKHSPYEWLDWMAPFRSLQHLSSNHADNVEESLSRPFRRIGKVWATLWEFREQRWEARTVNFERRRGERGVQQLTLALPHTPHLLQLGGEELAWRLISLPPSSTVKIALTPSNRDGNRDALDITVGRDYPYNDLIMAYLSRGALPEVERLAEVTEIADRMLYGKFDDPISAVAGAYVLLKTNKLERREHWLANLNRYFGHISDVRVIKASLAREQQGVPEKSIRQMLLECLEIGLPIFSLGLTLLLDSMAAMHRGEKETRRFHRAYLAVQAYARARCSNGAYLEFYGKSPAEPLWAPIYGTEKLGTATPVSKGGSRPVFMRRPAGSPRLGHYGSTSVALPRAPISGLMLETTSDSIGRSQLITPKERWLSSRDLPESVRDEIKLVRDSTFPSIEMMRIPEYLTVPGHGAAPRMRSSKFERMTAAPVTDESVFEVSAKRNSKYWSDARVSHSISVMDEGEWDS